MTFRRQRKGVRNSNEAPPTGISVVCGKTVKDQIRASYTTLTNTLYPYPMLDKLFEKNVIEVDLLNEIRNINNTEKCCQKLLEELLKKEEAAFVVFKDVLKEEQPWLWNTIWINPDNAESLDEISRALNLKEQSNITQNIHCFRELLEPIQKCEVRFLDHLLKQKCITWSQFKKISDKGTKEDMVEQLFDTMLRRSFDHYLLFIECLKLTYQRNMARIFESNGIVLDVHISVEPSEIEKCLADIITKSANIEDLGLTQSDKEIIKNILNQFEEKGIYIMGGSPTGSIIIFILCSTVDSVNELQKMFETGQLNKDLFTLFRHMVKDNFKFDEFIIAQTEFERGRSYFKFQLLQKPQACDYLCVIPDVLFEMILEQASRMIWVTLLIESFHTSSALQLIEYIKDGPDGFLRFVKETTAQIFCELSNVSGYWRKYVEKLQSVKRSLMSQIITTAIQRSWNILVDHMHVNDTLLKQLFEKDVLLNEEILECDSVPTKDRNKQILNILKQQDFKHLHKFLLLLEKRRQQHLTNRIISFGVHWEKFQDKWPLDVKIKLSIAANRDDLMKKMDLEKRFVFHAEYKKRSPDLISILLIGNCITDDQRNDLIRESEIAQKQQVLALLENGSLEMYKIFIEYFERTGQCDVVHLLQPNQKVQKYSHHIVNCLSNATDILNMLKRRIKSSLEDYSADSIQHTPFKSLNQFRKNETVASILECNQPDVYMCFLNGILRTKQPGILLPMFQSIPPSNVLGNFESYLMETIDSKYELLLKLRDSHVINSEQMRAIDLKGTLQERNKELLKIIFKTPPKYFNLFLTVLSQSSGSNILGNLQLTYSDPSNPGEDNFIADEVVDISHESESLEIPELVEVESEVLSICGLDRTDDFLPMSQHGSGEKTLNTGKTLRSRKTFVSPRKNKSSQLTSVVIRNEATLPAEIQNILFLKRVAIAKRSSVSVQNLSRHLSSILGYFTEISDASYHREVLLSNYSAIENLTITIDQEELTKNRVKYVYEVLTRNIDPKGYILNMLLEDGVLTSKERTEIEALPDQMIRAEILLSVLFNVEHSKAFTIFRESLLRDYSGIVQMIDRAHNLEPDLLTTTGNDPLTENTSNSALVSIFTLI